MPAAGSVFDLTVRAIACINCGAPQRVPPGGGTIECTHCRSALVVEARRSEAAQPTRPPLPDSAYDVQPFLRDSGQDGKPWSESIPVLERLWTEARREPERDDGYPLYASTLMLSAGHGAQHDQQRRRAVLETALELLPDRGHRCIVRCHLARAANRLGEREAAEAWFAPCDPRGLAPRAADEVRVTEASLANARGDHARVLELVLPARQATGASASLGAQLRIDSLEKVGRLAEARDELGVAIQRHGRMEVLGWLAVNDLAPRTRAAFAPRGRSRLGLAVSMAVVALLTGLIVWLVVAAVP